MGFVRSTSICFILFLLSNNRFCNEYLHNELCSHLFYVIGFAETLNNNNIWYAKDWITKKYLLFNVNRCKWLLFFSEGKYLNIRMLRNVRTSEIPNDYVNKNVIIRPIELYLNDYFWNMAYEPMCKAVIINASRIHGIALKDVDFILKTFNHDLIIKSRIEMLKIRNYFWGTLNVYNIHISG